MVRGPKIDWAATDRHDKDMEYVLKKMHASDENIDHSPQAKSFLTVDRNWVIMLLLFPRTMVDTQTTIVAFVSWVVSTTSNRVVLLVGSVTLQEQHPIYGPKSKSDGSFTNVENYGVLCEDLEGRKFKITGPKKIIMCGGSLNTPVVLQNSRFKNKLHWK